MRHVTYFIFILLIAGGFIACDDRGDFIENINSAPSISFASGGDSLLVDSLKVSLKHGQAQYHFTALVEDYDNNIALITYELVAGSGSFYQEGQVVNDSRFTIKEELIASYKPQDPGQHQIKLIVQDHFGTRAEAIIQLFVFENLPPVANFELSPIRVHNNLEYRINAQSSYDQDARFGGNIERYKFFINDIEVLVQQDYMMHIFAEKGNYSIKLQVQDNDGAWSDIREKIISI